MTLVGRKEPIPMNSSWMSARSILHDLPRNLLDAQADDLVLAAPELQRDHGGLRHAPDEQEVNGDAVLVAPKFRR
jgi:hypothetical protein